MSLQTLSLSSYFQEMWDKLKEINLVLVFSTLAVAILIIVVLAILKKKTGGFKWDTRKLSYASVCIALAFVLSFVRLWKMPMGGSVTAASMLPMLAYGYMAGPVWGAMAGLVYSVLQYIQEPYFLSVPQIFCDYFLPFTALSLLSGVINTKNKHVNLYVGFSLAIIVRYLFHVASGILFFAEYAPYNPIAYSFAYNSFVFVDAIPCFVLIAIPSVNKLFKKIPKK